MSKKYKIENGFKHEKSKIEENEATRDSQLQWGVPDLCWPFIN